MWLLKAWNVLQLVIKSVPAKKWLTSWPKSVHWINTNAKFLPKTEIQFELEKVKDITWRPYLITYGY